MMRPVLLLLSPLLALSLTGCGAITSMRQSDARADLELGIAALDAQQWSLARQKLEPLYRNHQHQRLGQQAMLLLIAADLDTRNPDRRLWAAADMSARLLSASELDPWLRPVVESYYLLALELGAQEQRLARADAARAAAEEVVAEAARALPEFGLESVPARISRVATERDELRRRVAELTTEAETRDRELRETKQELERVRQTIRH